MNFNRHAAAVVFNGNDILRIDTNFNLCRIAGQRFVNRVIDDFPDQMMRPFSEVEPIYMPGRFRTASNPSST